MKTVQEILEGLANDKYPTWEQDVAQAKTELKELVEGMKRKYFEGHNCKDYNLALSDVIALIDGR